MGIHEISTSERSSWGATSITSPMSPYGFYLRALFYNKKLFKEAGVAAPPKTLDEFMEASKKISALSGKYGYCLRGGPGGLNGWMMFGATSNGDNSFFKADGTSTAADPGWVKGYAFLADLYKNGYAPKDSVNWGFNEIVSGLLLRNLRDARPGSRCPDRHRRAHEQGRLTTSCRCPRAPPARPSRRSATAPGRCSRTREQGSRLEADRHARRARREHRLEQAHRRPADLQSGGEGPVLCGSQVQGLVRRARRQGRRADRHADLSRGVRLLRGLDRGQDDPAGPAGPAHASGHGDAVGRLPHEVAAEVLAKK